MYKFEKRVILKKAVSGRWYNDSRAAWLGSFQLIYQLFLCEQWGIMHIFEPPLVEKPTMWFPNRSDTNRSVQLQKQARSLKFWSEVEEELYYPSSENKGADQLRSYCEADLRLCFRLGRLLVFPCGCSFLINTEITALFLIKTHHYFHFNNRIRFSTAFKAISISTRILQAH